MIEHRSLKKTATKRTSAAANGGQRGVRGGLLTVGQTARLLGISPSTLRVWENLGLVAPARSGGKFRLYTPELLETLKRIKYLRDVKQLSVPSIKEMLGTEKQSKPRNAVDRRDMGPKLRRLRERGNLSLAEAARKASISTGFLSAIELGKAFPSVTTLYSLTAAYGTTVLELYDLPHNTSRHVRPEDRRIVKAGEDSNGVLMELLAFGTSSLECMLFRVPPKSGSDGAYSHEGEEFIYMLSGTLEVWLDERECFNLSAGDTLWFESKVGHRFSNTSGDETAVVLWVNTPPTF